MTDIRVTQDGIEVLSTVDPDVRGTSVGVEVLTSVEIKTRATVVGVELLWVEGEAGPAAQVRPQVLIVT